jgi:septum formation inhibitor MinC
MSDNFESTEADKSASSVEGAHVGVGIDAVVPDLHDQTKLGSSMSSSMNLSGSERLSAANELGSNVAVFRGAVVTARGTGDGLTLRLDARVPEQVLRKALWSFVESREAFLQGNSVNFEWVGGTPDAELVEALKSELKEQFEVRVVSSEVQEPTARLAGLLEKVKGESEKGLNSERAKGGAGLNSGLFSGVESIAGATGTKGSADRVQNSLVQRAKGLFGSKTNSAERSAPVTPSNEHSLGTIVPDALAWDDPDARVVYRTMRSGQKIETEHSLVVVGDVNTGAELIAGGDIIVLGHLRGVAHAGAYDETGGGHFIMALQLEPSQLRIGSVISRGESGGKATCPEIARVDGSLIVVEPYLARNVLSKLKKS